MSGKPWSNHGQKDLAILAQDGKEMGVREKPRSKFWGNVWEDEHSYLFYTDFLGDGT